MHIQNKQKAVIFLHIPKAAGTTLHQIIDRQYPQRAIFSFNADAITSVEQFKNLPEAQKSQIQVVKGHMGFGLHQYMSQPATYITILREPIERVISYYYHVLDNPAHYLHEEVTKDHVGLEAFTSDQLTAEIDNGQTRLLAGPEFMWTIPYGKCTPDLLEIAKQNLINHFLVVGVADQFDKTLILLKIALGWKNLSYKRSNVNVRRPEKQSISSQARANIEKDNPFDIQLYKFAQQLLKEQIRRNRFRFTVEYARFRAAAKLSGE
jgi:hypothetical protein